MNYDISNFPLDIVLNILSIVILFLLLKLLLYKPAKKILDERKERIAKEKADAENAVREAQFLKEEYENTLTNAESLAAAEAEKILAEARRKADEIVSEAEERAEKVLSLAESKIIAERQAAKKSIERDTVTLALNIAEKILERRVSDSDTINMAYKLFENADVK